MGVVDVLEVQSPGPLTTIQDMGRFGFGPFGVPRSGAVDPFSLRAGNLLVGNCETDAGLEVTLVGLSIRAIKDVCVAVTGADLGPAINKAPMEMWRASLLKKGDILSFRRYRLGCRAYLAVGGGIHTPIVLGSRSSNLTAGFGGLEGRPLKGGDILYSDSPERHLRWEGRALPAPPPLTLGPEQRLRVILGPQDHHFSPDAKELFLSAEFKVSSYSDRAGVRLEGPVIKALPELGESILSEGVVPGAIQVPGDGQPIILLGETVTGGYRKIATVISADLPLAGQLTPGNRVRFQAVSLEEAFAAAHQMEAILHRLASSLPDRDKGTLFVSERDSALRQSVTP